MNGAEDSLCTQYEGEIFEVGSGPIPGDESDANDTHYNCRCVREAIEDPLDSLSDEDLGLTGSGGGGGSGGSSGGSGLSTDVALLLTSLSLTALSGLNLFNKSQRHHKHE